MRVEFTNPRVAKNFVAAEGFPDRMVRIAKVYEGMLSNISFAGAKRMVDGKSNLIFKKEEEAAPNPLPPAEELPATETPAAPETT